MTLMQRRKALMTGKTGHSKNYVVVGSPSIQDGIMSVSQGSFIKTGKAFSPGSQPWKIRTKIRSTGSQTSYVDIFSSIDSNNNSVRSALIEFSSGGTAIGMFLSSIMTSWDISRSVAFNWPISSEWRWLELEFNGEKYITKYSKDGETFQNALVQESSTPIAGGFDIGYGVYRSGVLNGEYDLSECKIWIDGQLWWQAIT